MATDLRGVDDKCFKLSGRAIFLDDNRLTTFKLRSLVFPSSFDEAALRAILSGRALGNGRLLATAWPHGTRAQGNEAAIMLRDYRTRSMRRQRVAQHRGLGNLAR